MRLQKYIAECGIASRRKAQIIIETGRVKVNGNIIKEKSFQVSEEDVIVFDNKKITVNKKIYIVLNKPPKVICSHEDKWNRKRIYDIVKPKGIKLFSLGRLDYESCGIIILTNDGDFANKIIHPSSNIIKRYFVESLSLPPDKLISDFVKGVVIENEKYKAHKIVRSKTHSNGLIISLKEGKKREIRMVFNKYSLKIRILKRFAIGNLNLNKLNLKENEYRYYNRDELERMIF